MRLRAKGARTVHSRQIALGSEVTVVEKMKRCPKCGRIMMDERIKTGDLNEDGKEIEQDGNITWVEFDNRLLVDVNTGVLKLTGKEVEE